MVRNYQKFIFLFVVLALAFLGRAAYPAVTPGKTSQTSIVRENPPLLVLSNPSVPAGPTDASTTGGGNTQVSAGDAPGSVFKHVGTADAPSYAGQAYLIADLSTGTILNGVNTDKRWPTASITKLLTATVALDNLDPTAHVTITPDMFAADPQEFTLVVGGTYTVSDLMKVLLMPSSNVAAEALATYYGRTKFLDLMNARAQEWGMKDSYFDDPSGISAANQSTPANMLILAKHVYENYPQILAITRTAATTITELNYGSKVPVKSINNFAGQPDFIGGKTGHTNEAGGNLLSIFRYDGHPLLIVVLGTDDRFGQTQMLYRWFRQNFI